jgi:hypothetical protein
MADDDDLFDYGRRRRDLGMARAEAGAGETWLQTAEQFFYDYLRRNEIYFCDDIWAAGLPLLDGRRPKALGPLTLRLAKRGWMQQTGEARKSATSNMSLKPVWRSLIFERNAA